jgi:hypothetical protein
VRIALGDAVRTGRAIDLRDEEVEASAVARATRESDWVTCPTPGPVHERVSPVRDGMSLAVRSAVADAARTRGLSAPQDDTIAAVHEDLEELDPPAVDCETARRRVAEAGERESELAERVSELRGKIDALEDVDGDAGEVAEQRVAATRRLSEVRTERIAAEQALDRARERAREARDARARRLRLEDRAKNLRRAARDHLAARMREPFADAVQTVPGEGDVETATGDFAGDAATAALAVVRIADVDAPVVLACDRFDSPTAATTVLDAPVLQV